MDQCLNISYGLSSVLLKDAEDLFCQAKNCFVGRLFKNTVYKCICVCVHMYSCQNIWASVLAVCCALGRTSYNWIKYKLFQEVQQESANLFFLSYMW